MNDYLESNNIPTSPIRDPYKSIEEKLDEAIEDFENGRMISKEEVFEFIYNEFNIKL